MICGGDTTGWNRAIWIQSASSSSFFLYEFLDHFSLQNFRVFSIQVFPSLYTHRHKGKGCFLRRHASRLALLCCAFCLLLGLGYLGVVADSCVLRWWCQWNDPEPNAERGRTFAFCCCRCCSTLWQTSCFAWICVIDRFCGSDERCIAGKSLVPVWGMRYYYYYSGRGAREDSFFNSLFWPDLSGDLQKLILSPVKMHSGHFTDQDAPWKNCWSLILRTSRFASEQLLWWIWRRNVLLLLLLWV